MRCRVHCAIVGGGVEYWEHFKHVLWTEEINQGIGAQVRGGCSIGGGLIHNFGISFFDQFDLKIGQLFIQIKHKDMDSGELGALGKSQYVYCGYVVL